MSRCFSFTASRDILYRYTFAMHGLRSTLTTLDNNATTMHCWVPKTCTPTKPNIVLVHGFGANAMWQYAHVLRIFTSHFNVYVPDLLFFGQSFTSLPDRSVSFQAKCLMRVLETHGVRKVSLVGISYGGFVGYNAAAQFPEMVERTVLCCAGVCLEEKDMEDGLFYVKDVNDAEEILVPQTPERLKELMRVSFVKPATVVPNYFLTDFITVMCTDYVEEKKELIRNVLKDRQLSSIPKVTQPMLIIWGEQDQIFPLELAYRLKRHVGESAELAIIKNAGHAVNLEKAKEFAKHLKSFLVASLPG